MWKLNQARKRLDPSRRGYAGADVMNKERGERKKEGVTRQNAKVFTKVP